MSNVKQPPNTDGPLVLFADDERELQKLVGSELPRWGYRVTVCPDGETALAALEKDNYDVMLVDLDMPGINGIELIRRAHQNQPHISSIILTGKPSQETAIHAVDLEAFAYLTKPCRLSQLAEVLGRAVERRAARQKLAALEHRLRRAEGDAQMIGNHPRMEELRKLISKVAPKESTVLIRGETGSGKELAARAVHDHSGRADQPFVAVNCGALPETLIESELFGHSKGAFTGADTARTGLFQLADGGTLFLDEIGELPLAMQAKLLRVLESREIRRVGDDRTTKINVRIVAATHRDLEKMVQAGEFREDLMYRINTFELFVPPLRERTGDIPLLAKHLLARHRPEAAHTSVAFTPAALEMLQAHVWPGNIRELANVIEHASILCDQLPIDVQHLPREFRSRRLREEILESGPQTLSQLELKAIQQALKRHDGNKAAAATELGISLKTLYNRLNQDVGDKKAG